MSETKSLSHNACSVNHYNVSYWIQIDRGDFPVTDLVGEFSIIDAAFQVETYGTHLVSDRSFVKNYALRRCFVEFCNYLPSRLEGCRLSFAVLRQDYSIGREGNSVFHCRCFFCDPSCLDKVEFHPSPIDFDLSLAFENVRANKPKERIK